MEEKENDILTVEEKIVKMLRTVYDPEIPVNVYDLGLIYSIEVDDEKNVHIEMTLILIIYLNRVNVYDLGLIYSIEVDDEKNVHIEMTLTAPNCPAADFIIEDVRMKVESIDDVKSVDIQLVFEPEWDKDMMSEEAKLELGFL